MTKPSLGAIRTEIPIYNAETKVFSQIITFRSDKQKIDSDAIGWVAERAAEQFRVSLLMNGLDDFAWPPEEVAVKAHADQKGAIFTFGTRADKRKPVILLQ